MGKRMRLLRGADGTGIASHSGFAPHTSQASHVIQFGDSPKCRQICRWRQVLDSANSRMWRLALPSPRFFSRIGDLLNKVRQQASIALLPEQDAICGLAIASGPASFLVVLLDRLGQR